VRQLDSRMLRELASVKSTQPAQRRQLLLAAALAQADEPAATPAARATAAAKSASGEPEPPAEHAA
jgi:hypothetical protein